MDLTRLQIFLLTTFLTMSVMMSVAEVKGSDEFEKVVTYLGTTYLLEDGCPLPDCDPSVRGCFRRQIELRKKFNGCLVGKNGKSMGCVTETFASGQTVTLPLFVKLCSKICYYNGNEAEQERVHVCPFRGRIHQVAENQITVAAEKHPKKVVTYLGTDFILLDGCPLAECNQRNRGCLGRRNRAENEFEECSRSSNGDTLLGCITDRLANGSNITVPVFANVCSKYCYYAGSHEDLQRIHVCPYIGVQDQHADPVLQRFF